MQNYMISVNFTIAITLTFVFCLSAISFSAASGTAAQFGLAFVGLYMQYW